MTARTFEAVTTCSATGWREYGDRMAESFAKFWPAEVPLNLFSESLTLGGDLVHPMPRWLNEFRVRHMRDEMKAGMMRRGRQLRQYNYRFDALRFAYKTAVVIEAARISTADILIWVDADTVTHAPVTLAFLNELAPGPQQVISWLERSKSYPECGFYMLNLRSMLTMNLLQQWKALYESDRLFHLPEWHDSYVLMQLVQNLRCPAKSISGGMEHTGHPFINGPLGAVMDHMKGPRKHEGRSRKHDLKTDRTEPYWTAKR